MKLFKNKKFIIYYIAITIIILLGFAVGTKTYEYSEGYRVYDYTKKVDSNYSSKEIGNKTVHKIKGWYWAYLVEDHEYYQDNIRIPQQTIKESTFMLTYSEKDFHRVHHGEITSVSIIIIILLLIPIFVRFIIKKRNKY